MYERSLGESIMDTKIFALKFSHLELVDICACPLQFIHTQCQYPYVLSACAHTRGLFGDPVLPKANKAEVEMTNDLCSFELAN